MRLTEQMYTKGGQPPRLLSFAGRTLLCSGAIFAIFLFGDWAVGRFELWPLQLLGSALIGTFAVVLTPLETAEIDKLRVDGLNLELLDLTDRMARLSEADLSTFAAILTVRKQAVESMTVAGSAVDDMWRALIAAEMAARCDPGPIEAAAPDIRRYCLTPKGQLGIEMIVVPAVNRRVRAQAATFGRKADSDPPGG
jgi:hypothetical protein